MDLATTQMLPDCYRGCSPRSASTPGPAPDSPASGRFSASPLLSPCFASYYTHPLYASASAFFNGWMMMQQQRPIMAPPPSSTPSRLAFSVENILKPEFGVPVPVSPKNDHCPVTSVAPIKRAPLDSLMMTSLSVPPPPIKRPLEMLTSLGPAPIKRPLKAEVPVAAKRHQKSASVTSAVSIKSDPSADDSSSKSSSADSSSGEASGSDAGKEETRAELPTDPSKMTDPAKWPAWIFCTRYSDRPSSGPRCRRVKKERTAGAKAGSAEEKRPRTAFTSEQLARLKSEFNENRYLNEKRRQDLANELQLHENQIKIWFQNKRAKIKKTTGHKNPLAMQLMAQGLYNHSTVPVEEDDAEDYLPHNESSD